MFFAFAILSQIQNANTDEVMNNERCVPFEFGFFSITLRKNIEKVVGVKPDTDMNRVVQIVVVIIMTDK